VTLHVYAQTSAGDNAYIVGTRIDLARLRDSIDIALGARDQRRSSDMLAEFSDASGECYDLYVKVVPAAVEQKLVLPHANWAAGSVTGETPDVVPTE
jgi:hypothetical protein